MPIWVELDSNATSPASDRAADPPGDPVRVRAPLHRRHAQAQGRAPATSCAAPEGFRYYRDDLPSNEEKINDQRKRFEKVFRDASQGAGQAHEPLSRLGLHRRQRREHRPADAAHPRRRLRPARRHQPRRRRRPGHRAGVHGRHRRNHDPNPGDRAAGHGHVHGPVLPDQQLRGAGRLRPRLERQPGPARHLHGQLRLHHPARRRRRSGAAPARPSLYGHGLLGAAGEVGSSPQRTLAQAHNFVFCATDEIGFVRGGHPEHDRDPRRTSARSPSSPTAPSRACSTSSSSGG